MTKFIYYLKLIFFTVYLLFVFLLIDDLLKANFFSILFFFLNIVFAFITILAILSKKEVFKKTISYNLLSMGVFFYISIIYFIVFTNSKLDVLNNSIYFRNNYIILSILLLGLTIYTIILNKKNDSHS